MKLDEFERIEALASAIEDQRLLLLETNALASFYDQLERKTEQRFKDPAKQRFFYFFKENSLRWKSWIAEASNAYAHNLLFYRQRLKALLGD